MSGQAILSRYREFFVTATGIEKGPYPYQERLAVGEEQRSFELPELVDVPTGLGKTAAIVLAWLWRRHFHENLKVRKATPRRLVYCLPMRVLVEQTDNNKRDWLEKLGLFSDDPRDQKVLGGWAKDHGDSGPPIDDWQVSV